VFAKLKQLQDILHQIGQGVIAFSGGCDSTFLLAVAHEVLGDRVIALTAISPSLPEWERQDAERLGRLIGARHIWIETREMEREEYRSNPSNRCFFCKDELFSFACREASTMGLGVVMDGANLDDRGDHRPGRLAAKQHNVRSPLDEAGLTKQEIRDLSKHLGLPTWDKPAIACLASRFPYGTEISHERIARVAACEKLLRELGFRQFRARFHDTILRIEIDNCELPRAMEPDIRDALIRGCKQAGFLYVTLDLQGFRSGSMNEALPKQALSTAISASSQQAPSTAISISSQQALSTAISISSQQALSTAIPISSQQALSTAISTSSQQAPSTAIPISSQQALSTAADALHGASHS